jgi:tetratricopeptide (TPR) repeat protein
MGLVLFVCPALAAGQAPDAAAPDAAARAAYAEGERQYEAGNHQLALEAFERVRQLMTDNPAGRVLIGYNIAKCHDRLGRDAEALREYERYLADAPSGAPYRTETLDRVRELRGRVAASGASAAPTPSSPATPAGSGGSVLVPVGIAVASVGAAAMLAAIPTGVLALDREAQLEATCAGGRCPQSAQGVLDDAYLLGTLTDVLWIAGLSVAAIGAALAVVGVVTESGSPTAGAACTEEGCVATLGGSF